MSVIRKRVMIFFESVETFLPVVEKLKKDCGIDPVFWSASLKNKKIIEQSLGPIAHYDPLVNGLHSIPPKELRLEFNYSYINPKLLEEFAFHEHVFMEMLYTRTDPGGGFNYYEAKKIYHGYLAQAFGLIDRYSPDVLLMQSTPHLMWDYVLYFVAKHRGINLVMFYDTPIPGRMVVYKDLENCVPADCGSNQTTGDGKEHALQLPQEVNTYIDSLRRDFLSGTTYMIKARLPGKGDKGHWSFNEIKRRVKRQRNITTKSIVRECWNTLKGNQLDVTKKHYLKQEGNSWPDSFRFANSFFYQRLKDINKRGKLLNNYEELAIEPDFSRPYVYFPLHLQPENTTVPMGGLLSDQFLALTLLREALPDNWKIYVKENPLQFEWHRGSFARHPRYYSDISELKGVELVKLDSDPFDLIDNSQTVFTITGTTGWEAIVRGKPAMLAGNCVWYAGAPGVVRVRSVGDMKDAIKKIHQKLIVSNEEHLNKFLLKFLSKTYTCVIDANHIERLVKDKIKNTDEIVRAVAENI